MKPEPALHSRVTGVVLAGGRGARMNGQDKGLVVYRGRPLVERQLAVLKKQADALLVSANRNLERYRALGVGVVTDARPDYPGPLAGMLAAARAAQTPWIVCLPCDTLGVPADAAQRLVDAAEAARVDAAYAVGADGPQYTLCALRTTLADALEATLLAGRGAVRDFLFAQRAAQADFGDCALVNANTPDALQ